MKNAIIAVLIIVLILIVGAFVLAQSRNGNGTTGNVINNGNGNSGDVQRISLSMKNYNYYPETIKVNAGKPVSITLDDSVKGCLRAFTIRDLGVQQISRSPEQTIEFTPQDKGTYTFSCSMGMGYGTLLVL